VINQHYKESEEHPIKFSVPIVRLTVHGQPLLQWKQISLYRIFGHFFLQADFRLFFKEITVVINIKSMALFWKIHTNNTSAFQNSQAITMFADTTIFNISSRGEVICLPFIQAHLLSRAVTDPFLNRGYN